MSRSFRKHYILKDKDKYNKKYANRIVRRKMNQQESFTGQVGDYKKCYESWNITDFSTGFNNLQSWLYWQRSFYDSDEECIKDFNRHWRAK